jgi:hypothetical protein
MKIEVLFFTVLLSLASQTVVAQTRVIHAPKGIETKIGTMLGPDDMCFKVVSARTNLPSRSHFTALINGKHRDLDFNLGGRCLHNYGVLYNVYITPSEDVIVYATSKHEGHDYRPPLPPPGSPSNVR